MLSDTGRAAPELLLDAFSLHDPSLIETAVADDFAEHSAPPGMTPNKQALQAFVTALPGFRFDVDLRTEQGDLVMIYGHAEGTLRGPLFGSPATGRHGRWPEVHIFRVTNGQVTEHWDVIDQLAMRSQLGLPVSHA